MKKSQSSALIVIVLLMGILAVYLYTHLPSISPATQTVEQSASPTLSKETDALSVSLTYPVIPGTSNDVYTANSILKTQIDMQINDFEKEAIDSKNANIPLPPDDKSTVTGGPAIEEVNDRYAALTMSMEWYLRGAAHPWHSLDASVYDYQTKQFVSLPQMFKANSGYLNVLSKLSKEDLLAQSKEGDMGFTYDENMVNEGTAPKEENYADVIPHKDGLTVYFGEYQVGPYAAGPQQVTIPYVKLKEIIDPNGILGMYIK